MAQKVFKVRQGKICFKCTTIRYFFKPPKWLMKFFIATDLGNIVSKYSFQRVVFQNPVTSL
jgi:hypothetical protein